MTHRVGSKGQVVIPKEIRDRLRIVPGDEVEFTADDNAVQMRIARGGVSLRGQFAGLGLTKELEADHRAERLR